MTYVYRVLALSAFAFSCLSSSAWAREAPTTFGAIGLQDAIKLTLQHNSELAGYRFQLKALAGERQTAILRPELQVTTELENVAGSGELSGIDAGELTLSLSSVIELGGQRDARLSLMTARQQQLESSQRLLTLDVLTQVTHQFIRVVTAQEQLAVQQDALQLAQDTQHLLMQQVEAGRTSETELLRAKAALARATIDVRNAQQQLAGEQINLSAYWADVTPDFVAARADLFAFSEIAPLPELLARLNQNPDLALLTDAVQVRAAELRQAKAQGNRNLGWSAGIRHMQATDDSALVVGISIPLGAQHRASGAIAAANANQAGAEFQRDSAKIQLQAELMNLFEGYQQALNEVSSLQTEVLPPLKQVMRATADGFDRGRYSYLELNLAQRQLLDAQSALVTAAARAQTLSADIERLIGAPSHSSSAPAPQSEWKDLP